MAEAAAHAVKAAFAALMAGGGTVFVILILIVGIIGGAGVYREFPEQRAAECGSPGPYPGDPAVCQ